MRFGEQQTSLILTIGALILAVLVGALIPMASGSQLGTSPTNWTPLPSRTPTRKLDTPTVRFVARTAAITATPAAPAPTAIPTRTATPVPPTASPSARPAFETPSPIPLPPSPTIAPSPAAEPTRETAPTATPGAQSSFGTATVKEEPLSLRTWPSKDAAILILGFIGDTFTIVGRTADEEWLQVCCVKNTKVWVAAQFVEVSGSIQDVPVVQ